MYSPHHIRDQIAMFSDASRLRRPAFAVIDGLQQSDAIPGDQILGAAVALLAMCESANVPFHDVVTKAANAMSVVEGPFTSHLQSVRDYARRELREQEA
jgi:hypothetical protein